jgi:predicted dehydrogenase
VAIVGTHRLAAHVAAIESVASVRLIGTVREETDESVSVPEPMLTDPRVGALAVLTRAADREYWIRKAADCGRHVLSEQPVFSAHQALKLSSHCHHNGVALCVAGRVSSEPERVLREALADGALGTIVFIALDVFIPRDWIPQYTEQGVVAEFGAPFGVLLQHCFGPIDTVYARTRSLVANRPQEDIAIVQLRFKDGTEGTLQINALGSRARVCIAVYGSKGSAAFEVDLHQTDSIGLRKSYEELGQTPTEIPSHHATERSSRATALVEGLFIADWIHQSARHNTEVPRREARLG